MESNLNVHFVDFILTFLEAYLKGRENLSLFFLLPKLEEHESRFLWLSKSFRKESLHKKTLCLEHCYQMHKKIGQVLCISFLSLDLM